MAVDHCVKAMRQASVRKPSTGRIISMAGYCDGRMRTPSAERTPLPNVPLPSSSRMTHMHTRATV